MGTRVKLSAAARECAGADGDLWHALILKFKYGSPPTEADRERFAEIDIAIHKQVQQCLEGGEWEAWGWLPGDTKPVRIPVSLFERDDVDIDCTRNILSCTLIS